MVNLFEADGRAREAAMKWGVPVILLLFTVFPVTSPAQQPSAKAALTDSQSEGRRVFQRKCAMCHVPASATSKTLGTGLSKTTLDGNEDALRETIMNGLSNSMPGFKYTLTSTQVGNIIDFLKTLDTPARTLASERPER
jgi:mono/diheme cytochrome c family protein